MFHSSNNFSIEGQKYTEPVIKKSSPRFMPGSPLIKKSSPQFKNIEPVLSPNPNKIMIKN
jgi:hypothetical protein